MMICGTRAAEKIVANRARSGYRADNYPRPEKGCSHATPDSCPVHDAVVGLVCCAGASADERLEHGGADARANAMAAAGDGATTRARSNANADGAATTKDATASRSISETAYAETAFPLAQQEVRHTVRKHPNDRSEENSRREAGEDISSNDTEDTFYEGSQNC